MTDDKKDIQHKLHILRALDVDIQENKKVNVQEGFRQTRLKIKQKARKQLLIRIFNRAAAILILPLLLTTGALMYLLEDKAAEPLAPVAYTEVMALPGTIIKTQLPDSSEVWLNSGSTLIYPTRFAADKRTVKLKGEAFFEVKTHSRHPFEVEIRDNVTVTARGTSFNVNAYQEDKVVETILLKGIVDVYHNGSGLRLAPSEMATFDKAAGTIRKATVSPEERIAWKEGLLVFRSTPLDEVFKRISRRYNVEFIVHKETLADYPIRATFSSETLPQILDALKMAANIRWSEPKSRQNADLTYSRQQIEVWIK